MVPRHMKRIQVLGSRMAYVQAGEGPVVLSSTAIRPLPTSCVTSFSMSLRKRAAPPGRHFVQETHAEVIGQRIADWLSTLRPGARGVDSIHEAMSLPTGPGQP